MAFIKIYSVYLLCILLTISDCSGDFKNPGVCTRVIKETNLMPREETYLDLERIYKRCWYGPCTMWQTTVKTRIANKEIIETKLKSYCCDGYEFHRGECVPRCDDVCENGNCTAPNQCTCHEGYKFFSQFRCTPDCGAHCNHGRCAGPNMCECPNGYKLIGLDCEPMCSEPCENGTCIDVDVCQCYDGFEFQIDSNNICQPICDDPCLNGKCIAPNKCECHENFVLANNSTSECELYCPNCGNGTCITTNECICSDGFEMISKFSYDLGIIEQLCVEVCAEGYEREAINDFNCTPTCYTCEYGTCVKPGECQCWKGYKLIPSTGYETTCVPICENCNPPNVCLHPNHCECATGYDSEKTDNLHSGIATICRPHCDHPCNNGYCSSPNVCGCRDGFVFNEKSDQCEKPCPHECIFGECENGVCVCEQGFKLLPDSDHECHPYCNIPCVNGVCQAPDICQCDDGHVLQNGTECVPICSKECRNGTCIAHEMCECNEGFHLRGYQDHICVPICGNSIDNFDDETDDGCINGTCVEPNQCECLHGFRLENDNHTCILMNGLFMKSAEADADQNSARTTFLIIFAVLLIVSIILIIGYYRNYHADGKGYNVGEKEINLGIINNIDSSEFSG